MSTPNFKIWNANKYYVVNDTEHNIDWLKEDFSNNIPKEYQMDTRTNFADDHDRYYCSSPCEKQFVKFFKFGGVNVEVGLIPVLRSGYYSGANWDYLKYIVLERDWENDYDIEEEICEENVSLFCRNAFDNRGFAKIIAPKIYNKIAETIDELDDKFSELAERFSDMKLGCVGVFSNGEAIYERVS